MLALTVAGEALPMPELEFTFFQLVLYPKRLGK
jgi:hypothetical protein